LFFNGSSDFFWREGQLKRNLLAWLKTWLFLLQLIFFLAEMGFKIWAGFWWIWEL
jgi:hypothetical protein